MWYWNVNDFALAGSWGDTIVLAYCGPERFQLASRNKNILPLAGEAAPVHLPEHDRV
jgi:hypothetical protein